MDIPVKLYDTHYHLDLVDNYNDAISEIENNGIYTICVTNLPPLYEKLVAKVISKYIRVALGFHPELIDEYQQYIPQMWNLLDQTKYIGEVGLDYKVGKNKELQKKFFEELIFRCSSFKNKILSIHSRGAENDVVDIIGNNFNGKIILHWYSGSVSVLRKAISNGYYFSINSSMLNSKNGQNIFSQIPQDRVLLESDCPFVKIRNREYRPIDMDETIQKIEIFWNQEKTRSILWNNFKSLLISCNSITTPTSML